MFVNLYYDTALSQLIFVFIFSKQYLYIFWLILAISFYVACPSPGHHCGEETQIRKQFIRKPHQLKLV